MPIFFVVEGILDHCQFFKTIDELRLFLALHVHFNQNIQRRIRRIIHGWIMSFTMRLNGLGQSVQWQSVILTWVRIIGGYFLSGVVEMLVN